jgi:hypothetical protein
MKAMGLAGRSTDAHARACQRPERSNWFVPIRLTELTSESRTRTCANLFVIAMASLKTSNSAGRRGSEDRRTDRCHPSVGSRSRACAGRTHGRHHWLQPVNEPSSMRHQYYGIVEEVGGAVRSVKPRQFVIDSLNHRELAQVVCRSDFN